MGKHYEFYLLLGYTSFLSVILPLFIGIYRRRSLGPAISILFYLMCVSFVTEACIFVLHLYHVNNLFISRIYSLGEFTLISLFFIKAIPSAHVKSFIKIIIPLFFIVAGGDLYLNGLEKMDAITSAFESIVLMIYAVVAFYYLVVDPAHSNVLSSPYFWFYAGILMFGACDMFIFIFTNYIQSHYPNASYELMGIHFVNNILFYILISIGFWKTKVK